MEDERKPLFSRFMDRLDKVVNLLCVAFLFIQVATVVVMVAGRYFFNHVPRGTEQLALFCMVWFSLLSISLSVRDDSHIKMEIMDALVSPKNLTYFQYFAAFVTLVFSVCMIFYGHQLVGLTWNTRMSGVRMSEGWLYFSIPVSGVCMALASIAVIVEKARRPKNA